MGHNGRTIIGDQGSDWPNPWTHHSSIVIPHQPPCKSVTTLRDASSLYTVLPSGNTPGHRIYPLCSPLNKLWAPNTGALRAWSRCMVSLQLARLWRAKGVYQLGSTLRCFTGSSKSDTIGYPFFHPETPSSLRKPRGHRKYELDLDSSRAWHNWDRYGLWMATV